MEHVFPRKSGKSKKVGPFSRLEFPNGMSCSIYVSRSLYQFQVHGRAPPRTGVYDQMEQLFTKRKFHFCYHGNFRFFFLNGKRPLWQLIVKDRYCTMWLLLHPMTMSHLKLPYHAFRSVHLCRQFEVLHISSQWLRLLRLKTAWSSLTVW